MGKYKIYHIPGVKIGVSMRLRDRLRDQGYTLDDAEVIEEHDDIHYASTRERQLQQEYGYTIDNGRYYHSVLNSRKGNRHEVAKKGWKNRDRETAVKNAAEALRKSYKDNPSFVQRGERHSQARLKKEDVLMIRKLSSENKYTSQELADIYGITKGHCEAIISKRRWSHI